MGEFSSQRAVETYLFQVNWNIILLPAKWFLLKSGAKKMYPGFSTGKCVVLANNYVTYTFLLETEGSVRNAKYI